MLGLFGKKKEKGEGEEEQPAADASGEVDKPQAEAAKETPANLVAISTEIDRIKASVESFSEVRKSFSDRFSLVNEQIGELRAMILDRDRTIQEIELKSVKAADLVETVQPEKFMVELQKGQAKFEALKANLEGNEALMDRVMDELKEMRRKIEFFRGVEEVIKLSEEVKKELIEIKKVEADIQINTEKMQTMYSEIRKKYQAIDQFADTVTTLKATQEQQSKDIEIMKARVVGLAEKDELQGLADKMQKALTAATTSVKSSSLSKDVAELKTMLDMMKK